jgi:hypothetical protein
LGEKSRGAAKRISKTTRAANIVTSRMGHEGRRCRFRNYKGCTEEYAAVSCMNFWALDPESKQKALVESDLCVFCLSYNAGSEC